MKTEQEQAEKFAKYWSVYSFLIMFAAILIVIGFYLIGYAEGKKSCNKNNIEQLP